jgi:hypothetical protein
MPGKSGKSSGASRQAGKGRTVHVAPILRTNFAGVTVFTHF